LTRLRAITIGHRYSSSVVVVVPTDFSVIFLRYGRDGGCAYLREVDAADIERGVVDEPAPGEGKEHYLEIYRTEATPAVSDAFDALRRELEALGFTEKVHGKHRITYRAESHTAEVIFGSLLLKLSFTPESGVDDPDGRILNTVKKGKARCSVGIATEAEVDPAVALLRKAWRL
jgi:hypothetical protein